MFNNSSNFLVKIPLLTVLFLCAANFSFAEKELSVTVTDAHNALQQNDYNKAIEIYSLLIRNYDKYAPFFYGRGYAYYYLNRNDSAETDFQKAIALDSNYYDGYLGLAFVLMQKSENMKCNILLNKAAEINPNSAKVHYCKGLLNYIEQNYNDAITEFSAAINLDKQDLNAIYGRAISFYQINDDENAKRDFDKFLSSAAQENNELRNECKRFLTVIDKKN